MAQHPIQGLMQTAMENIKEMVDVNTIIGDAIHTPDGQVIIPVSKVGFGFAAGGSEFKVPRSKESVPSDMEERLPFGGGSGGGVSITPVAFIVVSGKEIKVLNMQSSTHLYDRLIDMFETLTKKKEKDSSQLDDMDPPHMYC